LGSSNGCAAKRSPRGFLGRGEPRLPQQTAYLSTLGSPQPHAPAEPAPSTMLLSCCGEPPAGRGGGRRWTASSPVGEYYTTYQLQLHKLENPRAYFKSENAHAQAL